MANQQQNQTPPTINNNPISLYTRCLVLVLCFLLFRLAYLARATIWSDEAVFGLMSIAIGTGEDYPLYCWGAHYASALISYIAVPLISMFGISSYVFRAATLPYGITLTILLFIGLKRHFDYWPSFLAALTFAIPVPTILVYSVSAHGGYPETYLLGFLIWLSVIDCLKQDTPGRFFLLGLFCGTSFTILWLGLPFIGSALLLLAYRKKLFTNRLVPLAVGSLIGSIPFWIYNLYIAPFATFKRLGGRSIEATADSNLIQAVAARLSSVGLWIQSSISGLEQLFLYSGGLIGFVILAIVCFLGMKKLKTKNPDWFVLALSFFICLALFNITGNLSRSRMWSPLCFGIIIAVLGLDKRSAMAVFSVIILLNIYGNLDVLKHTQPDNRIVKFSEIVKDQKPDALIADYDIGYPVAFLSGGKAPISASAPPNPTDRRPDWTEKIKTARNPAVILPNAYSASFEDALINHEASSSISKRYQVEDYTLYILKGDGATILENVRALQ